MGMRTSARTPTVLRGAKQFLFELRNREQNPAEQQIGEYESPGDVKCLSTEKCRRRSAALRFHQFAEPRLQSDRRERQRKPRRAESRQQSFGLLNRCRIDEE